MKTNYIFFLSILMSVLYLTDDLSAQNALVLDFNCSTNCIDLTIEDGTKPYEVEWQQLINGEFVTISGWPKIDLLGNDGSEDICVTADGTYHVIVHDVLCGSVVASESVEISELAMSSLVVITPSSCSIADGKIDYWKTGASQGVSPYSYEWSNGDEGQVIENLSAGTYTLTVTDAIGCSITVEHEVPGVGQPSSDIVIVNTCEGESNGQITVGFYPEIGPLEYSWESSLNGNVEILGEGLVKLTNLSVGTYCISATDIGNGCVANTCMTVNGIETEEIEIISGIVKPSCDFEATGSILPLSTGGYGIKNYSWSNGFDKQHLKNLLPGIYQVTVSDDCGNSDTEQFEIIGVDFDLEVKAEIKCVNIYSDIGSINLTLTGGSPPFSFYWSNGASTKDIQVSQYGLYTVTIVDNNGCELVESYQVNETFGTMNASVAVSDLAECEGEMNIVVQTTVFGGDAPYSYKWQDGSTGKNLSLNLPNSGQEEDQYYSVTITDACGNEEIISGNFVCNDLCEEHCIFAYKTGSECTDYCNDHPLYTYDIGCDKIKLKCNCDDDVTRTVVWQNGGMEATFVGKEAQEGSFTEEDVNTWDAITYTFHIQNQETGCASKFVLARDPDRCGTGFFPWVFETFGGGTINTSSENPCTEDEDWEIIDINDECVQTLQCLHDPDRTITKKTSTTCKFQDPLSLLWAEVEFCEEYCNQIAILNSSESEPSGISDCPDCLPLLTSPCDDPVDLFTYPNLNGSLLFTKNKNKDHFITKVLNPSGEVVRAVISENIDNYLIKYIRITNSEVLAAVLDKATLNHSLIKILPNMENEVIATFNGESIENLFVEDIESTTAHIITKSKSTGIYKKYEYSLNNKQVILMPGQYSSPGKMIWNSKNNFFNITSISGYKYLSQNSTLGLIQSNIIEWKVNITSVDQYQDEFIVTGIFSGSLNIGGKVVTSSNAYSSIIYWFDSNGSLIRYHKVDSKIITRTIVKSNVLVLIGYDLGTNTIPVETLEETTLIQNIEGICSFKDAIALNSPSIFQTTENFSSRAYKELSIEIFPNPTKDKIFIEINGKDDFIGNSFKAEIFNINGSKISISKIENIDNLDLSNLISGIYILKILNSKGEIIFSDKIIKL